jgi:formylglycine-generating enzyme required for sulfatase activity
VDGGAPLIASCAPSLTVPANSNCQALVPDFTQLFSVTDDCGSALVFDQVPAVGSSLGLGTYTVAITVEDVRGNQTTCTTSLSIVRSALCPNPIGFVQIQPGSFQMGSDAATGYPYYGEYDQARPPHQVTLTYPFWIGATEVTQSEYMSVMGVNPSHFFGLNRPVEQVSWDDARSYCAALSAQQASLGLLPSGYEYRLPTEAEWEYTCRAGTSTEFNVGPLLECSQAQFTYLDNWSTPCNNAPNTLPVASFPPNAWGLFDMHGNVWELCLDAFVPYTSAAKIDPFFPTGVNRIVRGGSWFYPRLHSRSALRAMYWDTSYRANYIGFRVVLGPILVP